MNQNFYNSNSSGFDQSQPPQFPVIHQPPQETSIEILHDQENAINSMQTFLKKFNRISFFEMPKVLLLAWDRVFKIKDALGNKQYKPEDTRKLFRELFNDVQNIHEELVDMGDEHLDTIPATESDEFIKSSFENLVPIPSDDDESSHEEDIHEMSFKTYSNPLFDLDEEIISSEFNLIHNEDLESTLKNDHFDTEPYLFESLLNRDTLMSSLLKIDSLLVEFASALIFLKSIPSRIDEADYDPEEDIHLVKRLLYDNSLPRPSEEIVSDNSNANIESFSPSPIPNKDSDSHMEEIDLPFTPDDPMPPGIEDDDYDSGKDIPILEELLDNYSLSSRTMSHTILIFLHLIVLLQNHQMEKPPDLAPHQGLEAFQPSAECPRMIINGKNTPVLDVPLFHFYPP
nr:hypothetical protein [Tanacetum cinerariifolium]